MIKTIRIIAGDQSDITIRDRITRGDYDAYQLAIVLPDVITGTAELRLAKPDGTWYDVDADVEGNTVTYMMQETDYDQTGELRCYVRLLDGDGGLYTPLIIRFMGVRG